MDLQSFLLFLLHPFRRLQDKAVGHRLGQRMECLYGQAANGHGTLMVGIFQCLCHLSAVTMVYFFTASVDPVASAMSKNGVSTGPGQTLVT